MPESKDDLILVVDDDAGFQDRISRLLTSKGYRVITASGWPEARAALEAHRDDIRLSIINVLLPQVSGVELMGIIRRRTERMCIIATAAPKRQPWLSVCRDIGADETILKSRSDETWAECVERVLRRTDD
jgi:DNA-binding response OmpR family regulator